MNEDKEEAFVRVSLSSLFCSPERLESEKLLFVLLCCCVVSPTETNLGGGQAKPIENGPSEYAAVVHITPILSLLQRVGGKNVQGPFWYFTPPTL